jgi:hypothetical protein
MTYLQLTHLARIYRAKYYHYKERGLGSIAYCFGAKLLKTVNELREMDKQIGMHT